MKSIMCTGTFLSIKSNAYLTLRLPSAGIRLKNLCNHMPSAGDLARTLHEKWCRQPGARLERYMKIGAVSRGPGYTHRPSV